MNKRVLYMLNYPGKGGTEKYVLDLISAVGPGNSVLVYSEEGPGLDMFREIGVPLFQVQMGHPFDFKAALKLKKIVSDQKVDVIHAQFLRENYIALLTKMLGAKVNVIWTYHVDVPMNRLIRKSNGIMTKFNSKVIAVSRFMLNQLEEKGISKHKLKLIYNGVQDQPQVNFNYNREIPVITVIGRLREEKGQEFLIKSLHHLNIQMPELKWYCHLYGEGPDKDKLMKLTKELDLESRVFFKGFSNDKDEMYCSSDIVVIPSSNEALSYVAIEALSYGKVVIATEVGGLPEVVKDQETGLLVQYGDIEGLAENFKRLLLNKELMVSFSVKGKTYFQDHFKSENMIKETLSQYNL